MSLEHIFQSLRPKPNQLRHDRNKPCFCGSGKKYKKCCHITKMKAEELDKALKEGKYQEEATAAVEEAFNSISAANILGNRDGKEEESTYKEEDNKEEGK